MKIELIELQKIMKIKWNKFYVCRDSNSSDSGINFEVMPDEFLEFAKKSYRDHNKMGLVDAVANSKRAIDCQIDWIIAYLGYDYLNFNEKRYPNLISEINIFEENESLNKEFTFKLRFIQALNIAPTFLISQIREIRNKIEHEYKLPSDEKAKESIEVAELFINATQNILFNKFFVEYYIQNEEDNDTKKVRPYCCINFDLSSCEIEIYYKGKNEERQLNIMITDDEYIYFIKAAISHNFYYLVKAFGYNIDEKYVNYEVDDFI